MPIRCDLRFLYPLHWKEISRRVRFTRAGVVCVRAPTMPPRALRAASSCLRLRHETKSFEAGAHCGGPFAPSRSATPWRPAMSRWTMILAQARQ